MRGEIIAIGDELTSGRILNTTSGFAARKLFDAGYTIGAMSTIGDTVELIGEALLRAIGRADFIIVTGGLGSTDDDLTNEAVAQALGLPTRADPELLGKIRERLEQRQAPPHSPLEKIAWLPRGARPFDPSARTAGYQLIHADTPIFFLPGVPSEMRQLMSQAVLPTLAAWQAGSRLKTRQRIYKIFGIPESEVNRLITGLNLPAQVKIGYYPVFPDVHLSILIRGEPGNDTRQVFTESCTAVETLLQEAIYGTEQDELEMVTGAMLVRAGLRFTAAESCSGGLLCQRMTSVPGCSTYFLGGVVSYANELKRDFLGVSEELLVQHGAVSAEVAQAMARGVRLATGADLALALTGIAGPDGGSPEKPVGTVYLCLADHEREYTTLHHFQGERHHIQTLAVQHGLNILRLYLAKRLSGEEYIVHT
jgi:nicotinamide-nucleotide amidase